MTKEKIERINELARKSRTPQGLTDEEKAEQTALRNEYRAGVVRSLEDRLDSIEFTDAPLVKKENDK